MNASPEKELRNPWEGRADFARIEKRSLAFSLLVVFLCALTLPLALFYESVSLLVLAALFIYVAVTVRVPFSVILLLLTAFVSVVFTGSFAVGAMVLALIVGTGAMAFLFTAMERSYLLLLLPAIACGISFAVLGDWRISLLAFTFLPSAILLAVATRLGKNRTTAICFAEAGLLLIVVGALAYFLYSESAKRGISVADYIDRLRESLVNLLLELREELLETVRENANTAEEIETFEKAFSEGLLRDLAAQTFNIFPALCCVFCGIVAFEAQILLNGIYRAVGWKQVLTIQSMVFTMSLPAAVIYFATFVVSIFSNGFSLPMAVIDNLNLILLPGFCVIGMTMLALNFARAKGGARVLWILLLGAILCCYSTGALSLLALFGSNSVILGAMHRKMLNKSQDGGDDSAV